MPFVRSGLGTSSRFLLNGCLSGDVSGDADDGDRLGESGVLGEDGIDIIWSILDMLAGLSVINPSCNFSMITPGQTK